MRALITDTMFKNDMEHYFPPEYKRLNFQGYHPDVCFTKEKREIVVLELENKSDRKPYVGALLEACCFAEKKK